MILGQIPGETQPASPTPAEAPRGWTKSCGRCRRSYGLAQWRELPVIECLPAAAVQSHMSVPAAWTVELRPCACGALLAATTRHRDRPKAAATR